MSLTITLPESINSASEAKAYLKLLHDTGYIYHPDDPASDIEWNKRMDHQPTTDECTQMDMLMSSCFDWSMAPFDDVYDYILQLDPDYREQLKNEQ